MLASTSTLVQYVVESTINKVPSNIVWGLLNSKKGNIPQYVSELLCNVIQTLESDFGEAEQFVQEIASGNVPAIFQDLSQNAVAQLSDVINITFTLPTAFLSAAEHCHRAHESIRRHQRRKHRQRPLTVWGSIVADITNGWEDFTAGVTDTWNDITSGIDCFFGNFPRPTDAARACLVPSTRNFHPHTNRHPLAPPMQLTHTQVRRACMELLRRRLN